MSTFISLNRRLGVEPICRVMEAPVSTYYESLKRGPSKRAQKDEGLKNEIKRVHKANFSVYGARKIWHQLRREGTVVARCTVERLMKDLGLEGARRGKKYKTTVPDNAALRPADLVERNFSADRPNRLWVADLTYVRTWSGMCHVAFVVDAFSRGIVGWSLATHLRTELVLEALEMAIWNRGEMPEGLVHHSDRGSQYTSIHYTERLADAGIAPSIGSVGDSYDNALAESTIGLYKTELTKRRGPWKTPQQLELATLEWVDWWNKIRLHESLGSIPPAEKEGLYYCSEEQVMLLKNVV